MPALVAPHAHGRRSLAKIGAAVTMSAVLVVAAIGSPAARSVARRTGWHAVADLRIAARIAVRYLANARG